VKNLASLKKKAKEGNVVSQHKVGSYYYKKKDYLNVLYWWKLAGLENDYGKSLFNLGVMYQNAEGVKQDLKKSKKYILESIKKLDCPLGSAYFCLGSIYRYGRGVSVNIPKGINFYKLAASHDHVAAMEMLGLIYSGGAISKKYTNKKLGFKYYLQAAAKGFAVAQYHTALCYLHGEGVKKDINLCVYYFKLVLKNKNIKSPDITESVLAAMKEITKEYKDKLKKIFKNSQIK
jgi:uncharacterized protein